MGAVLFLLSFYLSIFFNCDLAKLFVAGRNPAQTPTHTFLLLMPDPLIHKIKTPYVDDRVCKNGSLSFVKVQHGPPLNRGGPGRSWEVHMFWRDYFDLARGRLLPKLMKLKRVFFLGPAGRSCAKGYAFAIEQQGMVVFSKNIFLFSSKNPPSYFC